MATAAITIATIPTTTAAVNQLLRTLRESNRLQRYPCRALLLTKRFFAMILGGVDRTAEHLPTGHLVKAGARKTRHGARQVVRQRRVRAG